MDTVLRFARDTFKKSFAGAVAMENFKQLLNEEIGAKKGSAAASSSQVPAGDQMVS